MACFRFRRSVLLLACACAVFGVWGCSPSVTEVSGTIKIKGQPPKVKGLEISFLGADGRPASAQINPDDGTYTATAVPTGDVKVCFVHMPEGASGRRTTRNLTKPGQENDAAAKGPIVDPIPEALRDTTTSKISVNLVAGQKNVFNYDIKP
jgi:hypothetical protein